MSFQPSRTPNVSHSSAYDDFCRRLFSQREQAFKLGLDRVRAALDACGSPDRDYPSVIVGGTNGKGSVTSLIHAGLVGSGLKTGLYTSPHLVEVTERIRVDGQPIGEDCCAELGRYVLDRFLDNAASDERLTFFEILTVMACLHFREAGVQAAVFEVGLGGRLDATNAMRHELAVVTPVGLDHTRELGPDIASIFNEKKAILRPLLPAVVCLPDGWSSEETRTAAEQMGARPLLVEGQQFGVIPGAVSHARHLPLRRDGAGEVALKAPKFGVIPNAVFYARDLPLRRDGAGEVAPKAPKGADVLVSECHVLDRSRQLHVLDHHFDTAWIPFPGEHQWRNAACALAALDAGRGGLSTAIAPLNELPALLARARWPGRWSEIRIGGLTVHLDCAHNPQGARSAAQTIGRSFERKVTLVMAAMARKDHARMLDLLLPLAERVVAVPLSDPDALPAMELAREITARGVACRVADSIEEGLRDAGSTGEPVVCLGSIYLVGELMALAGLGPEQLQVLDSV